MNFDRYYAECIVADVVGTVGVGIVVVANEFGAAFAADVVADADAAVVDGDDDDAVAVGGKHDFDELVEDFELLLDEAAAMLAFVVSHYFFAP